MTLIHMLQICVKEIWHTIKMISTYISDLKQKVSITESESVS